MFIGHYAVALAAKKAAPKTSLGTLIIAAQFIDLIWPVLVLTGLERVSVDPGNTAFTPLDFSHYPYSHSLLMVMAWASLLAVFYRYVVGYKAGAVTLWWLVVSHWVLDLLTHRPDLPLYPGGREVGLGLWNSISGTLVLEVSLFALGVFIFSGVTRPRDRWGRFSLRAMVVFLLALYAANLFGPPPPGPRLVAWSALLLWLLVPWGYWIDRHRRPRRL
jgi:membrane-bound metal-dependent hydrolase YbcI (DUF457 family)